MHPKKKEPHPQNSSKKQSKQQAEQSSSAQEDPLYPRRSSLQNCMTRSTSAEQRATQPAETSTRNPSTKPSSSAMQSTQSPSRTKLSQKHSLCSNNQHLFFRGFRDPGNVCVLTQPRTTAQNKGSDSYTAHMSFLQLTVNMRQYELINYSGMFIIQLG